MCVGHIMAQVINWTEIQQKKTEIVHSMQTKAQSTHSATSKMKMNETEQKND